MSKWTYGVSNPGLAYLFEYVLLYKLKLVFDSG